MTDVINLAVAPADLDGDGSARVNLLYLNGVPMVPFDEGVILVRDGRDAVHLTTVRMDASAMVLVPFTVVQSNVSRNS